ncbi:MAG: hypothetical protein OXN15_06735, partial [Chloroflexota bacterium]|nr:hypothetical protein [Chloroflexota bacterium]
AGARGLAPILPPRVGAVWLPAGPLWLFWHVPSRWLLLYTVFYDSIAEGVLMSDSINMAEFQRLIAGDADYDRRSKLISSQHAECISEHPHQWVALAEDDVWVFADSLEALVAELDVQGLPRSSAVIRYLDPNPPKLKL